MYKKDKFTKLSLSEFKKMLNKLPMKENWNLFLEALANGVFIDDILFLDWACEQINKENNSFIDLYVSCTILHALADKKPRFINDWPITGFEKRLNMSEPLSSDRIYLKIRIACTVLLLVENSTIDVPDDLIKKCTNIIVLFSETGCVDKKTIAFR